MIDLDGITGIIYEQDPYRAAADCDAIAVMTEWKLYAELDYNRIYDTMAKSALYSMAGISLTIKACIKSGFNVFPIGRTPLTHY